MINGIERLAAIGARGVKNSAWGRETAREKPNRSGAGSEHSEQVALIRIVRINLAKWPELHNLFAVPNGEKRAMSVANRLKMEGVVSGVPDLVLAVMRAPYGALFIEMKAPGRQTKREGSKGGLSDDQIIWKGQLVGAGYAYFVAYSAEEAWAAIENYLGGKQNAH